MIFGMIFRIFSSVGVEKSEVDRSFVYWVFHGDGGVSEGDVGAGRCGIGCRVWW